MNIGILRSVNFTKQKRDAKPGISVCSRIFRLMKNQTKNQRKANIPKNEEESDGEECCGYCENCTTIGLRLARLGTIGFSKRKTVPGKPMQKVMGSIRKVRFTESTIRQASIQEKNGPSLGKIQIKNLHQRSPYAVKFEDRSHEETERQQRCARSKAWNLAKNQKTQREKPRLHSTRPRKSGYSRLRQQKSRRKESMWWIPERACTWSASETLTLLSRRPRGHREYRR